MPIPDEFIGNFANATKGEAAKSGIPDEFLFPKEQEPGMVNLPGESKLPMWDQFRLSHIAPDDDATMERELRKLVGPGQKVEKSTATGKWLYQDGEDAGGQPIMRPVFNDEMDWGSIADVAKTAVAHAGEVYKKGGRLVGGMLPWFAAGPEMGLVSKVAPVAALTAAAGEQVGDAAREGAAQLLGVGQNMSASQGEVNRREVGQLTEAGKTALEEIPGQITGAVTAKVLSPGNIGLFSPAWLTPERQAIINEFKKQGIPYTYSDIAPVGGMAQKFDTYAESSLLGSAPMQTFRQNQNKTLWQRAQSLLDGLGGPVSTGEDSKVASAHASETLFSGIKQRAATLREAMGQEYTRIQTLVVESTEAERKALAAEASGNKLAANTLKNEAKAAQLKAEALLHDAELKAGNLTKTAEGMKTSAGGSEHAFVGEGGGTSLWEQAKALEDKAAGISADARTQANQLLAEAAASSERAGALGEMAKKAESRIQLLAGGRPIELTSLRGELESLKALPQADLVRNNPQLGRLLDKVINSGKEPINFDTVRDLRSELSKAMDSSDMIKSGQNKIAGDFLRRLDADFNRWATANGLEDVAESWKTARQLWGKERAILNTGTGKKLNAMLSNPEIKGDPERLVASEFAPGKDATIRRIYALGGPEAQKELSSSFLQQLIEKNSTRIDGEAGYTLGIAGLKSDIKRYGSTLKTILGDEVYGNLTRLVDLGSNARRSFAATGNTSGTARTSIGSKSIEMALLSIAAGGGVTTGMKAGAGIKGGAEIGAAGAAAVLGFPWLVAKALTNPKFTDYLTGQMINAHTAYGVGQAVRAATNSYAKIPTPANVFTPQIEGD